MHCGWMPSDDWIGERGSFPPIGGYEGDVCPGYLACLPIAREAEVACAAFRMGHLKEYFPDQESTVLNAAMELHGAFNRYEAEQLAKT